jgi:glutamate synthase domain-containing protein 1
MHDRSNGLGGGFAGYGIYPEYKDCYAFHIFFLDVDATPAKGDKAATEKKSAAEVKALCEDFLERRFEIIHFGEIPTRKMPEIKDEPIIMRYFCKPLNTRLEKSQLDEREYVVRSVMRINTTIDGAYVFSSGKNMGVFKANAFPEDVGRYYRLEEYEGYSWTAHGRYPTNTPGWWGGAHPFALLDYSIVHNGEISSYDANRRYIEMFGYKCSLMTDTEVITYIIDYLHRRQGLTLQEVAQVIAASFWQTIDLKDEKQREKEVFLRNAFASLLITGPFSILLGFEGGMMALNDRLKLRSMVYGQKDDMFYVASEECAIRRIAPELDWVKAPKGGEAVIVTLNS